MPSTLIALRHMTYLTSKPSTQLSEWHFHSISILVVFSWSVEAFVLCILQVISTRSWRDLLDLNNMNTAKSVCPSSFLLCSSKKRSMSWCTSFFTKKSLTLNWVRRFADLAFCFCFWWNIYRVIQDIWFSRLFVDLGWLFYSEWCKTI